MKLNRIIAVMCAVALISVAAAARLRVNIGYGSNGSHGEYICYLYKGGYLHAIKGVTNTGFGGGYVEFDVPRNDKYFAWIHCRTNNRYALSDGLWFHWYWSTLTLTARYP